MERARNGQWTMGAAGVQVMVLIAATVCTAVRAAAAEGKLAAGDLAPAFRVERFLKGEAFEQLEKGKVYVVEFWATSCGPCVQTIPALTRLQQAYGEQGVIVCGVDVWEDGKWTEETLKKVQGFVERQGKKMAYRVAYDGAAKFMDAAWLKASGAPGIPWAVVVDREGRIAWMGHSLQAELVVEEVVAGRWEVKEGPARLKAAGAEFAAALAAYKQGLAAGDAAWRIAAGAHPAMGRMKRAERFAAMLAAGHDAAAFTLGQEVVAEAKRSGDAAEMQEMMVPLRERGGALDAAGKALLREAAEATFALSDQAESATHLLMAENWWVLGEVAKGRAEGALAIERSVPEAREATTRYVREMEGKHAGGH